MADGIILRLPSRPPSRHEPTEPDLTDPESPPFEDAPLAEVIPWPRPPPAPPKARTPSAPVIRARRASRAADRLLERELAADEMPTWTARELEIASFCREERLDVRAYPFGTVVSAGTSLRAEVPMWGPGLPERVPLVGFQHEDCVIQVPESSAVWVLRDGRLLTRPELLEIHALVVDDSGALSLTMELLDRVEIRLGSMALVLGFRRPAPTAARPSMDLGFASVLTTAALAAGALVTALLLNRG